MFDVGFWEILLIGVIALIIIGPKKLPTVARQAGRMAGKVQYFVNKFKDDINKEFKAEELKKTLAQQAESLGVNELIEDFKSETEEIKTARDELLQDADPDKLAEITKPKSKIKSKESG